MTDEEDAFSAFDRISEIIAFVGKRFGQDGVQHVLSMWIADGAWRESLQQCAAELRSVGLPDLAKIVRRYARRAPSRPPDRAPFEERFGGTT